MKRTDCMSSLLAEGDAALERRDSLLHALRTAVGAGQLRDDAHTLARYACSTSGHSTRPLAVAMPASTAEVAALLQVARRYQLPVYPLSTGKNWGYGDACAVSDGQLIIELSRMNRIIEVDPALAYAVIEPGVTQRQLSDYLREHRLKLWMDCTGAGPDTSLMGNILERGFGHSPYGDRLRHVAGMQVMLASGDVFDTGFGHYPQARTSHLFPYGLGPFLDGLFTQSNFGIVTRIGIWLMPEAACINHFLCRVDHHQDIAGVVDALRPLRLDGTLRSIVHIGNDLRVLSGGQVFPSAEADSRQALPQALRDSMRDMAGVGAWTVSGALYGSAAQVGAARQALRRALAGTGAAVSFLTEGKLRAAAMLARLLGNSRSGRRWQAKVALGTALFAMNRGTPDGRFLAGAYWRRRQGLPASFPQGADPARDQCGMLWLSPVLPLRGADLMALHEMVEPVLRQYGFDLLVTFSMINERALGAVLTIAFDKDDPAAALRAQACYRTLFELVMKAGYIPYRVGLQSMAALDPDQDVYWKTVAQIKRALDPDGLIAPGRYEPLRALRDSAG